MESKGQEFESRYALEHLDKLAYEIGPRLAGTKGERAAGSYIEQQFNSCGLKTQVQEFKFTSSRARAEFSGTVLAVAFIATLFLPARFSLPGWVIALLLTASASKILPKHRSANLIAARPAKSPKRRVLISAHYDSAQELRARWLRPWLKFATFPLLGVITVCLCLGAIDLIPWRLAWACLAVPFLLTCAGKIAVTGPRVSPGANDNASGVSVLLELARVLARSAPQDLEFTCVAFGAEEQGLVGSKAFAKSLNERDLSAINLDTVGKGRFYVVEGNGSLFKTRTSAGLNSELTEVGKRMGVKIGKWWSPLSRHDHIPLVKKGVKATTLSAGSFRRTGVDGFVSRVFRIPNPFSRIDPVIHSRDDLPEEIELKNIELAGNLVLEFLKNSGGEPSESRSDV